MGVRLIFENSTAYRKSVPTDVSGSVWLPCCVVVRSGSALFLVHYEIVCGGALLGVTVLARVCQVSFGGLFWVVVFPFVDLGVSAFVVGVPRFIWHSMESLILAQDERWRRA